MFRRLLQLLAALCLFAQVGVAVAPPGAGICLKSLMASVIPAPEPEAVCDCCRHEPAPTHEQATGHEAHEKGCPAGCGCCITVPVVDRVNLVASTPHQGDHVFLAAAVVSVPLAVIDADPTVWSFPPYWDPPPTFAAPLRTIRLLI